MDISSISSRINSTIAKEGEKLVELIETNKHVDENGNYTDIYLNIRSTITHLKDLEYKLNYKEGE